MSGFTTDRRGLAHRPSWIWTLWLLAVTGCQWDVGSVDIRLIYTSDAANLPLDSRVVKRLRVKMTGDDLPTMDRSFDLQGGGSSLLSNIPLGKNRIVTVEGLDAGGYVYSRGISGLFDTLAEHQKLYLFISRVGQFSGPPAVSGAIEPEWEKRYRSHPRSLRSFHSSTLLSDGSLLLAGGASAVDELDALARVTSDGVLRTAERFDCSAAAFIKFAGAEGEDCEPEETLCLRRGRAFHSASLLRGKTSALLIGGEPLGEPSAEYYDLTRHSFSDAPAMHHPRTRHGAASLEGQVEGVLLAGGTDAALGLLKTIERFDERTGTFSLLSETVELGQPRTGAVVVSYDNGAVVIGGWAQWEEWPAQGQPQRTPSAQVHRMDFGIDPPGVGVFSLQRPRAEFTAVLLPDEEEPKVLVCGGLQNATQVESSCELVLPAQNTSVLIDGLKVDRWLHTATVVPDGRVLVAGGFSSGTSPSAYNSALLLDPLGGKRTELIVMVSKRAGHTATLLDNGLVALIGGLERNGAAAGIPYEMFNPQ